MAEAVYRIETLRERVLAVLRKEKTAIAHDALVAKLGLPVWAVDAGLEAALLAGLAEFAAGQGYWIAAGPVGLAVAEVAHAAR